jgi:predicted PhzF superfamily epimerase YddE/YHI9
LLGTTSSWWHERLDSATQVDELDGPLVPEQDATQLWAWQDESAGIVRVRTFAARFGSPEDEACGSGAMRLAAALGRRLLMNHGKGSVIHAAPGPPRSHYAATWRSFLALRRDGNTYRVAPGRPFMGVTVAVHGG